MDGDAGSACPGGQWALSLTRMDRVINHPANLEVNMTIEQLQQLVRAFGLETCAPYTSQTQLIRNIPAAMRRRTLLLD
jgi:hypothetical protein